jgi:hypothetical protein
MDKRSGMKEKSCALGSGADEPMVDWNEQSFG